MKHYLGLNYMKYLPTFELLNQQFHMVQSNSPFNVLSPTLIHLSSRD